MSRRAHSLRASFVLLGAAALLVACPGARERPPGTGTVQNNNLGGSCGDGVLDPGEACDHLISAGPGACPSTCADGASCTSDQTAGSTAACSLTCVFTPITTCVNGDGCCAGGCDNSTDDDCSATCGDGTTDPGETCDGDCPDSCDDANACTIDTALGSAESCSFECTYAAISQCAGGDGCCPAGCTNATDNDCSSTCGNNMLDPGETCDGDCPSTCDDQEVCTADSQTGSADNCNLVCVNAPITQCVTGDGCCPSGCMFDTDNDCPAPPASLIGGPCQTAADCPALPSGWSSLCLPSFPGGYCTAECGSGGTCPTGSRCNIAFEVPLCILPCVDESECRTPDYQCQSGAFDNLEVPFDACLPTS